MNKKCHIVTDDNKLVVNIYDEDVLILIQNFDSRSNIEVDDETTDNERVDQPFADEDHLREWVSATHPGEEIEYIDEVPGSNDEDEEVPVEA